MLCLHYICYLFVTYLSNFYVETPGGASLPANAGAMINFFILIKILPLPDVETLHCNVSAANNTGAMAIVDVIFHIVPFPT